MQGSSTFFSPRTPWLRETLSRDPHPRRPKFRPDIHIFYLELSGSHTHTHTHHPPTALSLSLSIPLLTTTHTHTNTPAHAYTHTNTHFHAHTPLYTHLVLYFVSLLCVFTCVNPALCCMCVCCVCVGWCKGLFVTLTNTSSLALRLQTQTLSTISR